MDWLLAILQTALFVFGAPLLLGWVKRLKSLSQNRQPAPVIQPYRDLRRLFHKEVIVSHKASWIFRVSPYIIFGTAVLAAAVIPLLTTSLPTSAIADVIVLIGFFALGRFFLALAGMDTGTAFGGMGASREMTIASMAEPAMLMAVFTLAMTASTTNLSTAMTFVLHEGLVLRPSFVFAALGLMMVAVAETGRIPIDNPATHLELTMVHEAMILEYSGRYLALIEWASQIKLMVYGVLVLNLFFPWGIATSFTAQALLIGAVTIVAKLMLLIFILVISETTLAKMRLFRIPQYLSFAFLLCLLGALSHVILEVA